MRITENENAYSTRERQDLIYKYLLENTDKDHVVSTQKIINYLDTFDIKTHINMLYKDMREIEMVYSVTIEYNQKKKGYQLKNTLFKSYEVRLIAHSIESFKFITDKKARQLIEKLKELTDQYTASSIYSDAYVLGRIHSNNEEIIDAADRIYQAIAEDKKIRFEFLFSYKEDENGQMIRSKYAEIVSPYKLIWKDSNLSVLVYSPMRGYCVVFDINSMDNVSKPIRGPRDGKEEYKEILKTGLREFIEGEPYNVRVKANPFMYSEMAYKFGSDIIVQPYDLLHDIFSFQIFDKYDFFEWLISCRGSAELKAPPGLVEEMKSYVKDTIEDLTTVVLPMYEKDGET